MKHKTIFKITSKVIKGKQKLEIVDKGNEAPEFCKNNVVALLLVCGRIAQKMAQSNQSFQKNYTCNIALSFIDNGQGSVDAEFLAKGKRGAVFVNGIQSFIDEDPKFMQAMGFSLNGGKND